MLDPSAGVGVNLKWAAVQIVHRCTAAEGERKKRSDKERDRETETETEGVCVNA